MKPMIVFFAFVLFISCSDNVTKNEVLPFELRLAESNPSSNLVEMTMYNSDLKFFVADSIFLNNDYITSAEVIDWETQPKVMVELNDEGRKIFAAFTEENVGKNAAILVDKKLISAPKINAPITEGKLIIVGLFSHEEALKFAQGILP
jgi:preprotein translocase subunit SecD